MYKELELLEALRTLMFTQARASAPYVPFTSGQYRRVAESVEVLLNTKVAADIGYEGPAQVRRAAREALTQLEEFEEHVSNASARGRRYLREYRALRRLARMQDEPVKHG